MSNLDREDSRGTRVSRITPLSCVTMVVVTLVALAMGGLYLRRLYNEHLREVEELMAAMHAVRAGSPGTSSGTPPGLSVRAIARKYQWHFHYPGADGVYGKTSLQQMSAGNPAGLDYKDPDAQDDLITQELVLPCATQVEITTDSADVIHSLGNLHGDFELDATPGINAKGLLDTPAAPVSGTVRCVQLCGAGHKDHHAPYQFVTGADFEKWLKAQPTVESTAAKSAADPSGK